MGSWIWLDKCHDWQPIIADSRTPCKKIYGQIPIPIPCTDILYSKHRIHDVRQTATRNRCLTSLFVKIACRQFRIRTAKPWVLCTRIIALLGAPYSKLGHVIVVLQIEFLVNLDIDLHTVRFHLKTRVIFVMLLVGEIIRSCVISNFRLNKVGLEINGQ